MALLVDYGIRAVLIGAAACLGCTLAGAPGAAGWCSASHAQRRRGHEPPVPQLDERQGTAEVRDATRVFNQMAGQLGQAFRGRGLLMAAISHDLRTPLTRMRIRLEGLLPDPRRSAAWRTSER
jgi:signal transduction histidine kinase